MYEIWSLGHKPFGGYTNLQVGTTYSKRVLNTLHEFYAPMFYYKL